LVLVCAVCVSADATSIVILRGCDFFVFPQKTTLKTMSLDKKNRLLAI